MFILQLKRWLRGGLLCTLGLAAGLAPATAISAPTFSEPMLEIDPFLLQDFGPRNGPQQDAPVLRVAQSAETAQLILRIQQLEEQLRNLTGQVEGLQFQLTQMQTLIERMNEDNEFRFQQLEGGGSGNGEAATQSGDAMSTGALPQTQPEANDQAAMGDEPTGPSGERLSPDEIVIDPSFDEPMDDLGPSGDPLIGKAAPGEVSPLGTVPQQDIEALAGKPLDFSLGGGSPAPSADADAQYAAGYDALVRGDYDFAEQQFSEFVELYPDDPRIAEATSWLGQSLIRLGAYDEAAEVLFNGFQRFPESERAPDLLLNLGVALAGAEEVETACRTFAEVQKRYPDQPQAFRNRVSDEARRAQCQG